MDLTVLNTMLAALYNKTRLADKPAQWHEAANTEYMLAKAQIDAAAMQPIEPEPEGKQGVKPKRGK